MSDCELCELTAEPGLEAAGPYHPVWRDDKLKVIMVDDQNYPGFCRVIWNDHVKEMTDLPPSDRKHMMDTFRQAHDHRPQDQQPPASREERQIDL